MRLLLFTLSFIASQIYCMDLMMLNQHQSQYQSPQFETVALRNASLKLNHYIRSFADLPPITTVVGNSTTANHNMSSKIGLYYLTKGMSYYFIDQKESANSSSPSHVTEQKLNKKHFITREQAVNLLDEDIYSHLQDMYPKIIAHILSANSNIGIILSMWADQDSNLPQEYAAFLDKDCRSQLALDVPAYLEIKNSCFYKYKCTIL